MAKTINIVFGIATFIVFIIILQPLQTQNWVGFTKEEQTFWIAIISAVIAFIVVIVSEEISKWIEKRNLKRKKQNKQK